MKAIILISSIFYILGLKLSHKFDLVKKCDSTEKTITNVIPATKQDKTFDISKELKATSDSVIVNSSFEKQVDKAAHF